ncbi:MAG: FMN-binding protein [bacterium]
MKNITFPPFVDLFEIDLIGFLSRYCQLKRVQAIGFGGFSMQKYSLLVVVCLISLLLTSCLKKTPYDFLPDESLKNVHDGIYIGKVKKGLERAEVEVTMKSGKIEQVRIIDVMAFGWRNKAVREGIPEQFVQKQSLDIDAITGASGSSRAIKMAVSEALKKSLGEQK